MAKALKTIGVIAGAVALVATGVGAFAAPASALAATAGKVAAIAGVVAGVSNIGAGILTRPPPARGSVTDVIVEVDPPSPYAMGEGYFAGVKRFHAGYGATLKKVRNPYFAEVYVYSHGGPIEGPMTPQFDFAGVGSWFSGFFEYDSQLGACPEASALVAPYGTPTGWTAAHKLSGQAAVLWNHKFDKDGKRYASGLPTRGVSTKWVKAYDPRKDNTFPGGSGAHRITDESTWEWTANPALHAGTYAYGRYQNGKRVMGMGLPFEAIGDSFAQIAAWANDCDANGWTMFGVVFEGGAAATPGRRWANLRDICIAGGGEPMPLNTGVGFHWDRPRVVLDTITEEDISGDLDITAMQSWRDRLNTIIPKFTSAAHDWELMPAEAIQNATYLAEDGEERRETFPFNFVRDEDQAGQLAAYRLANSRELLLTVRCMPRLRHYRPGDCLQMDVAQNGEVVVDSPVVIVNREVHLESYEVTLTLMGETAAKHAWALGQSAVLPPSPTIGQTPQQRDETAAGAAEPAGLSTIKLSSSYTRGLAGYITQVHNGTGTGTVTVTIPDHTRVYSDGTEVVVVGGDIVLDEESTYLLVYDDEDFAGGELGVDVALVAIQPGVGGATAGDAHFSAANPYRHYLAEVITVDEAGSGGGTGGSSPPGGGGWSGDPGTSIP